MKVSLILATKNRVDEVNRFVQSLSNQGNIDMELLVVDQNTDDRLESVLAEAKKRLPTIHLRAKSGLSHARNVGLASASGEIISFPDDDCWYPKGLLARVLPVFETNRTIDGLTGRSEDGDGTPSGGNFSRGQGQLNLKNVWKRGISYTIFLRSPVCAAVGSFDEELGVGARTPFGSGEETDYLIRTIKLGFNIQYLPDLVVFHPNPVLYNKNHCEKAFRYGVGMGKVLSKHRYTLAFNIYTILRPIGGVLLSLATLRARKASYHLAIARGRICGLRS
jgi:glycosyltransferase involved in cell wall biosynthesis